MGVLVLARFTFREAVRKKILFAALGLTVVFFILFWVGSYFAFRDMQAGRLSPAIQRFAAAQILLSGLYVVNFMAGLLAIFTSAGTIAGEIEQGTLHAVVPKPIHRWEIVVGKWLGFASMLSLYVIVSSAIAIAVVYSLGGYLPPLPIAGLALGILSVLLLLSLTMMLSTLVSTIAAGIVVFMLYGVGTVGGMIEQLGAILQNETMVNLAIITSLIIPSDVLWKMSSYFLQPPAPLGGLAARGAGPFTVATPPSAPMVIYSVCYTAAAIGVALLAFRRRDL
jgi:Cu-processing system permease protein